jgi:hypothetical protein
MSHPGDITVAVGFFFNLDEDTRYEIHDNLVNPIRLRSLFHQPVANNFIILSPISRNLAPPPSTRNMRPLVSSPKVSRVRVSSTREGSGD